MFETLQELFTVPDTSIHVNDFCSYVQEQENTKVPQNQKTYRLEFQVYTVPLITITKTIIDTHKPNLIREKRTKLGIRMTNIEILALANYF